MSYDLIVLFLDGGSHTSILSHTILSLTLSLYVILGINFL